MIDLEVKTRIYEVRDGDDFLPPKAISKRMLNRGTTNGVVNFRGYNSGFYDDFEREGPLRTYTIEGSDVIIDSFSQWPNRPIRIHSEDGEFDKTVKVLEGILKGKLVDMTEVNYDISDLNDDM